MSIRVERVAQKIKFEAARILQNQISDPRMGFVTVVKVDLSADYRHATIHVSLLSDDPGERSKIMHMLDDARPYVQGLIAGRLRTRLTPILRFKLDTGVEKSIEIGSLLEELKSEREEREARQAAERGEGVEGEDVEGEGVEGPDAEGADAEGTDAGPTTA